MKDSRAALIALLLLATPMVATAAATPAPPAPAAPAPAAPAAARPPAATPDGWPDTPAGAVARDWVNAFSAGEDSMAACLTRHLPPESLAKRPMAERLTTYRRMREPLGTLALFSIDRQSPTEIKATLIAADLSKHPFTFTIQAEAPWHLRSVSTTQGMHGHFPGLGWLHH